jgi:hypothetical protein
MERDKRGGYNRKKVDENFFKVWSPKMAYVLGFIYADGAIEDCRESSRTCYLTLANNDIDILREMMAAMATEHTILKRDPRIIKIRDKEYWCKTSYCVRIGNKIIYDDLIKFGLCPRKSLDIELPEIPNQYFEYFLRGYFDGDGCVNVEKTMKNRMNIIFTSGSKLFLDQLAIKIAYMYPKIKSSVSCGQGAYRLRYNWRNALMIAEYIYHDIAQAPFLKYKYEKYTNYLSARKMSA